MPDISNLKRKQTRSPTPVEEESSSEEEEDSTTITEEMIIPEACLACRKEKVTHLTVPCRHPCLCRACAMKMATGGRCKVPHPESLFLLPIQKCCVGKMLC